MKKIIFTALLLLSAPKMLVAGMCSWDNAKILVKDFLNNEVARKANQYNTKLSTIGKKMFSVSELEANGINIKFLPATKYYINGYFIEDFKIMDSVGKGNAMSFDVEMYNYTYGWYNKAEMRIIDGQNGCVIKPSAISTTDGETSISPYFNIQKFKM